MAGTTFYAYHWVVSALADPGIASYENNLMFPLSAFVVFRGVYLLVGGFLIVLVELILFEVLDSGDLNLAHSVNPAVDRKTSSKRQNS
jgi:hypothetical protein